MNWVPWFQKYLKAPIPVCVGLATSDIGERIGTECLYVDRAYWDRANKYRIIRNGIHLKHQLDRPGDRMDGVTIQPWREDGEFIVVIPPSRWQIERIPGADKWEVRVKTTREIRVKYDKAIPLKEYLQGAWGVISYGSVAAVKAAMWGYPVLSGPHCPASPVSCEDIENPVLKDREAWLRSLSYAQWTMAEVLRMSFEDYQYCES